VLVNSLYLYIEHRVGVDGYSSCLFYDPGQPLFVSVLYPRKSLLKLLLLAVSLQLAKTRKIGDPGITDDTGDQRREFRIRLQQPAPLRDAIGLVVKAFGKHLIELGDQRSLH